MTVYVVKIYDDIHHPMEFYIDSIWDNEDDAIKRVGAVRAFDASIEEFSIRKGETV